MLQVTAKVLCCATVLLAAGEALPQAAWTKLQRVELFGNEYVALADWADLYHFKLERSKKDEEITLTSKWSRLVFTVNSRQAEINGVTVYGSVPIARRNHEAFIATLDLRTMVQPLLFPARNEKAGKLKTICLDPGHGGRDPGNQEGKNLEKKYTLLLAQELQKQLKEAGFKAVLARSSDTYVELAKRPDYARKQKADLFISLHLNGALDASVKGVETYCLTPSHASSTNARGEGANTGAYEANKYDDRNLLLAWQVQKALLKGLSATDRGVRRARFAVLKYATMPAILVEAGFMSNPAEAKNLYTVDYRKKIAKAIVEGLTAYQKAVEKQ